jgi:hypothetical protein
MLMCFLGDRSRRVMKVMYEGRRYGNYTRKFDYIYGLRQRIQIRRNDLGGLFLRGLRVMYHFRNSWRRIRDIKRRRRV